MKLGTKGILHDTKLPPIAGWVIIAIFFSFFLFRSVDQMARTPLHDYDEANRAEGARQMAIHEEWLFPVTGSPFLRNEMQRIVVREDPLQYVYRHFERPPLAFWTMAFFTHIFGQSELWFRFPSLLFALGTMVSIIIFAVRRYGWGSPSAFITAVLLLTAGDIWLSGNYAMLDTTLMFFLTLSLISLLVASRKINPYRYFLLSGVFAGLAILSKGQQAAIIAFPVLYLLITRQASIKALVVWGGGALAVVLPWFMAASVAFGIQEVVEVFILGFVKSRATIPDATQRAPIFWYVRYLFDSFRPGIFLFAALTAHAAFTRRISRPMQILLSFIIGTLALYSLAPNKVWWYVMPTIPVMVLFVAEALHTHAKHMHQVPWALPFVILLGSLPFALYQSNTMVLEYGAIVIVAMLIILRIPLLHASSTATTWVFGASCIVAVALFAMRFPPILPTYPEAKAVGEVYAQLKGTTKCLYALDMPYESILFYSRANSIEYLTDETKLNPACTNYLVTPSDQSADPIFSSGRLKLYVLPTE